MDNKSKKLSSGDDSAAQLLIELLDGSPGRNFDIESIFLEKSDDGSWKWWVFEFLKCESDKPGIDVKSSHPNRYWHKNKRKFLSLWAVVKCLRKAGYKAELVLINYDDKKEFIKRMLVKDINEHDPGDWTQKGKVINGKRNHIRTEDKVMTFSEFKRRFRDFNNNKKGETWQILEEL